VSKKKFSWKSKIIYSLFFVLVFSFCIKAEDSQKSCRPCCDPRLGILLDLVSENEGQVNTLESKVDVLDEKVDTIDSKVDVVDEKVNTLVDDLSTVNSKIDVLDEKVDTIDSKIDDVIKIVISIDSVLDIIDISTDLNVTIDSKVDVLDEKTDTINSKLDVANIELISIESKLDTWVGPLLETMDNKIDTIDSKVDAIQEDVAPINSKIDLLDEKMDTVDSKLDNLTDSVIILDSLVDEINIDTDFNETINSKVDVLDEKTDTIGSKLDVANIELGSIESKIDNWVGPLLETIDNKLDTVESKIDYSVGPLLETIDSKIDLLVSGLVPVNSGDTITESGVYFLQEQINCPITIDADNVRLDLNGFEICGTCTGVTVSENRSNIVIKNGSLIGAAGCAYDCAQENLVAASGIVINAGAQLVTIEDMTIFGYDKGVSFVGTATQEIRSCHVKNCVVECCNTGYDLSYVIKTEFDNTKALNCYNTGFYQENSQYNVYRNADALQIQNDDAQNRAIGFASVDGAGNVYQQCLAEGISTTTGPLEAGAIGFLFEGNETESKILDSIANSISVEDGTAIAYGMLLDGVYTDLTLTSSYDHGADAGAVAWSHNVEYLALGGAAGTGDYEIRILSFASPLELLTSATFGATVNAVDWRSRDEFIAVGGATPSDGNEIKIYAFDGTRLDELEDARGTHGATVNSVDFSLSGEYLAVGGVASTDGYEVRVFTFDTVHLDEIIGARYSHCGTVNSVAWSPYTNYLAIGGATNNNSYEVRVLGFNKTSLYNLPLGVYNQGATVNYVAWSPNQNYLAIVSEVVSGGSELKILRFDCDALTELTSAVYASSVAINSVSWSPSSDRLVVGTDNGTSELLVFEFNGSELTQVPGLSYDHGADVYSVNWSENGKYIALGGANGTDDVEVRAFSVMNYPTKCLLEKNKACNCTGARNAVGFSGSSGTNSIVRNTSYDNDVNYSAGITNIYDPTNDYLNDISGNVSLPQRTDECCDPQVNTELFIYSEMTDPLGAISSKVDVLDNSVEAVNIELSSIESKLDQWIGPLDETINSKIDSVNIELTSIESKLDQWLGPLVETIDAKIDTLVGGIILSGSSTISTAGKYSLTGCTTGCVVINADDVVVDLKNFTLYCDSSNPAIAILPDHKNIKIKNGKIRGNNLANDGILTGSGNQLIKIEDVTIFSCDTGVKFVGTVTNTIKDCKITNCVIQGCNIGADLDYTIKTKFQNCKALNCVDAGFYQENCNYNVYQNSKALRTQNSDPDTFAIGFASVDGTGNLFTSCIAEGISTTTGTLANGAVGFLLEGDETESKIINCVANSSEVLGDTGIAYGIKLSGVRDVPSVTTYNRGSVANVYAVDWSPDVNYLAFGGDNNANNVGVRVLGWDGVSLSEITTATFDHGTAVLSLHWSPNGKYLAIGGYISGGASVRVFDFTGLLLDELSTYNYDGSTVRTVKWSPDGNYLAIGGQAASDEVRVLNFESETLSLIPGAVYDHGATIISVDWSPDGKFLVVGGENGSGGAEVGLLRFDGKILSVIDGYDQSATVLSVAWAQNQDYIAISTVSGSDYEVRVLYFDGTMLYGIVDSVYIAAGSLGPIAWSANGEYLAVGKGGVGFIKELLIFSFNGYSLTQVFAHLHGRPSIFSIDWSKNEKYIAFGVEADDAVRALYNVMDYPSKCLLDSNKVCNSTGVNAGIGIAGSGGTNTIIRNVMSDNDTNLGTGIYNFATGLSSSPNVFDNLSVE